MVAVSLKNETSPVTKNTREALLRTYEATPDPKWVVALGGCALDGGCFAGSYAVAGGVAGVAGAAVALPAPLRTVTR